MPSPHRLSKSFDRAPAVRQRGENTPFLWRSFGADNRDQPLHGKIQAVQLPQRLVNYLIVIFWRGNRSQDRSLESRLGVWGDCVESVRCRLCQALLWDASEISLTETLCLGAELLTWNALRCDIRPGLASIRE